MRGTHRYMADDLEGISVKHGARIEIIDGELHIHRPIVNPEHQAATQALSLTLFGWSEDQGLGRSVVAPGVIFGPHDEVAPDTMWISRERFRGALNENGHLTVAPELMVEVVSPDEADQRRVRGLKLKLYAERGVHEYWIADWSRETVEIYRRVAGGLSVVETLGEGDTLTSPMLPGFSLAVDELWQPISRWRRPPRAEATASAAPPQR